MSYAIKYSFKYHGLINNELIEGYLLRKNYTGTETVLHCVDGEGVVITTRKSDMESVGAGIFGKSCTVGLVYKNDLDIDDFFVDDARAWQLVIVRGGVEFFRGYVKTEMSVRPLSFVPFAFQITATDGLADLKDKLVLNSYGYISSTVRTPVDMLLYLLGNTGINYNLRTILDIKYIELNDNPLTSHKIDSLRFVKDLEPISVFDALMMLCSAYRCKLIQHEGAWVFMSVGATQSTAPFVYEYFYVTVNGVSTVTELSQEALSTDYKVKVGTYTNLPNFNTQNAFIGQASEMFERSVKKKKYKFEYGSPKNRLWVPFVDGLQYLDAEYWINGSYNSTPNTTVSLVASSNYTNLSNIKFSLIGREDAAPTYLARVEGAHLGQPEAPTFVKYGDIEVFDNEEVTIKLDITNVNCRGGRIMVILAQTDAGNYNKTYSLDEGGTWAELDYPNNKTAKSILVENVHKEIIDTKTVSFANQDSYSFSVKSSKCPANGIVNLYLLPAVAFEEEVVSTGGFLNLTTEQVISITTNSIVYLSNGGKWQWKGTGDKILQSSYDSVLNTEFVEYSQLAIETTRKSSVNELDYEELTIENTANIDGIVDDKENVIAFGEAGNQNNYARILALDGSEYGQNWYSSNYINNVMSFKKLSCINDFVLTATSRRVIEGAIKGNNYKIPFGIKIDASRFGNDVFQILESKENLSTGIAEVMLSKVVTTKPNTLKIVSKNNFGGTSSAAVAGSTNTNGGQPTSVVSENGTTLTYRAGQNLTAGTLVMLDNTGYLIPFEPIHENAGRLIGMVRNGDYITYQFVDVAKTGDSILLPFGIISFAIGVNYWAAPNGGITNTPPVQNSTNNALSQLVGKTIKPAGRVFTMLEMTIGEPYKIV